VWGGGNGDGGRCLPSACMGFLCARLTCMPDAYPPPLSALPGPFLTPIAHIPGRIPSVLQGRCPRVHAAFKSGPCVHGLPPFWMTSCRAETGLPPSACVCVCGGVRFCHVLCAVWAHQALRVCVCACVCALSS
jgi:hypothetical protein